MKQFGFGWVLLSLKQSSISKDVCRHKTQVNEDNVENERVLILTNDYVLTVFFCYSL